MFIATNSFGCHNPINMDKNRLSMQSKTVIQLVIITQAKRKRSARMDLHIYIPVHSIIKKKCVKMIK